MPFSDVIGQDYAKKYLLNSLQNGRLAHTYLFQGPEGVGKRLMAFLLAKALNCEHGHDPCERCSHCMKINRSIHPDLFVLRPQGAMRSIKIEGVRELQRMISLKAYEAAYKVCIIDDADTMNVAAGNAFLKTLEEPPSHTVLILVTANPEGLLPTVTSRCQVVKFYHLPVRDVTSILQERFGIGEEDAHLLGIASEGRLGAALQMHRTGALKKREEMLRQFISRKVPQMEAVFQAVEAILGELDAAKARLKKALDSEARELDTHGSKEMEDKNKAFVSGEYLKEFDSRLRSLLLWFRDVLVWKESGSRELLINSDMYDSIREYAIGLTTGELLDKMTQLQRCSENIHRNSNKRLSLEVLLLNLFA